MQTLRAVIYIVWALFWIGWWLAAGTAKQSAGGRRARFPIFLPAVVVVVVVARVVHHGSLIVTNPVLGGVGSALFAGGLALAIWARVTMGANWGMPMTQKAEPELVTGGPFRWIRHPIYSGLVLALVGTGLATNLIDLLVALLVLVSVSFITTVEEQNLTATFPTQYPAYQARTKKLIPFVL